MAWIRDSGALSLAFVLSVASMVAVGFSEETGRHPRVRREVRWSGVLGAVTCMPKVVEAAQNCGQLLDERINGRDRDADDNVKCCVYAAFRHCVRVEAERECGEDAGHVVSDVVRGIQKVMAEKCAHYEYYSPTCIFINWFNLIVIAGIFFAILSCGCCLGSWCCSRG